MCSVRQDGMGQVPDTNQVSCMCFAERRVRSARCRCVDVNPSWCPCSVACSFHGTTRGHAILYVCVCLRPTRRLTQRMSASCMSATRGLAGNRCPVTRQRFEIATAEAVTIQQMVRELMEPRESFRARYINNDGWFPNLLSSAAATSCSPSAECISLHAHADCVCHASSVPLIHAQSVTALLACHQKD